MNPSFHPESLHLLPADERDFSHHEVYGTLGATQLPTMDFDVSPVQLVLQQFYSDFCTAFSGSELNTYLQGILGNPSLVDYLFSLGKDPTLTARAQLATAFGLVKSPAEYVALAKTGQNGVINMRLIDLLKQDHRYPYFCPLWQFAKTKQVRGEYTSFGANLRDAMQSLRTYGSLLKAFSPFTFAEEKPSDKDRDFIANWKNWPTDLDTKAMPFKIGSFWSVDGPLDMFDDIRSAMYKNLSEKSPAGVIFGVCWRPEWSTAPGGIIPEATYKVPEGSPHGVFIRGQKIINGTICLRVQGSNGTDQGDKGFFYFPRSVINIEATAGFGAFTAKDLSAGDAKWYSDNGIKITDALLVQALKLIVAWITRLSGGKL